MLLCAKREVIKTQRTPQLGRGKRIEKLVSVRGGSGNGGVLLIFCPGLKTLGGCANYYVHIVQAVACDSRGRQEEIKKKEEEEEGKNTLPWMLEELCTRTGLWVDVQLLIKSSQGSLMLSVGWKSQNIHGVYVLLLWNLFLSMRKDLERRKQRVFG